MEAKNVVIAVVGATGQQGGGLVRAILTKQGHNFAARAITRDPTSEKALALKALGAEVVKADILNTDELTKAIEGAYGMFCVTTTTTGPEDEASQAKSMAEAARRAGIKHVIWSTLEDTREKIPLGTKMPIIKGKYNAADIDVKGESDKFFADLPTTYVLAAMFWENFVYYMGPRRGPDGNLYITMPLGGKTIAGQATEDIGKCAFGIFQGADKFIGKRVGIVSEFLTADQMAEKLSKALGKTVRNNDMDLDVYRKLPFPGAEELANMYVYLREHPAINYQDIHNPVLCRELNPEMKTFDEWLEENKNRIKVA